MATLKAPPSQNFLQKTLDAQLTSGTTASATLNNTTGLQNLPGVMVIDRINTSDVETPTKREVIAYTGISGSTVTGLTRNADSSGSDQDHAVGAIVEFVPDVLWAQSIYDVINQEHGTDGTHDVSAMISGGSVLDEDTMSSDSATKLATQQSIKAYVDGKLIDEDDMASDSDTQAPTQQSVKAYVDAQSSSTDGWITSADTWTYASASTFTIAGVDRTSVYVPGTKLKFTQTGVKYGVVLSSSFSTNTTVTIAVNTDYTIANAAITSPYYSYAETPQGYPEFFNYTPTHGGFSAAPASGIYKFAVKGKTCIVIVRDTAAGTSNATSFTISTPVTSKNTTNYYSGSHAMVQDNGTYSFARAYIPHNSATITYQKTANSDTGFTSSGNKSGEFTLTYEIAS